MNCPLGFMFGENPGAITHELARLQCYRRRTHLSLVYPMKFKTAALGYWLGRMQPVVLLGWRYQCSCNSVRKEWESVMRRTLENTVLRSIFKKVCEISILELCLQIADLWVLY